MSDARRQRAKAARLHLKWLVKNIFPNPMYATAYKGIHESQKINAANMRMPVLPSNTNGPKTVIRLIEKDTLGAVRELRLKYPNDVIACLNNGNSQTRGGGFKGGGRAQEEDLCHCSSLWFNLRRRFYPFFGAELIYSTNVIVVKEKDTSDPNPQNHHNVDLQPQDYFYVDVITSAAHYHPETTIVQRVDNDGQQVPTEIYSSPVDVMTMRNKIRNILHAAVINGVQRLVLAPFGCGMFRNPPGEVARIMKGLLIDETNADGTSADWGRYGLVEIVIGVYDISPTKNVWNAFMTEFRQGGGLHTAGGVDVPDQVQHTTFPPVNAS